MTDDRWPDRYSGAIVLDVSLSGMFEDSAVKAFHDTRFVSAQRNRRPVCALAQIEVRYNREERSR